MMRYSASNRWWNVSPYLPSNLIDDWQFEGVRKAAKEFMKIAESLSFGVS
jgi:hypothetical protein